MSNQFIFNQYYIDLIKRIKTSAKNMRESDDSDDHAFGKSTLKAIKDNYITLDKSSDEYIIYVKSIPEDFWTSYINIDDIDAVNDWFLADDVKDVCIYKNISVSSIRKLVKDDYLCHHFFSVFYLFMNELSDDDVKMYLSVLQDTKNEVGVADITNEAHKKLVERLNELKTKKAKDASGASGGASAGTGGGGVGGIDMSQMEGTMLGKLAKEIMEDVDVEKLQKSIGENGDILKAIGDPDSGFSELISNVSRKMANKISTGELKQENLLQDAIKFASAMPGGLFGGGSGAGANAGAAGGGAGANQGTSKGGGSGGSQPDMSSMMNMMSAMMNNKEGMDMFKNMMGNMNNQKGGSGGGGSRQTVNRPALKKLAAVNKLKTKLAKRRETDE